MYSTLCTHSTRFQCVSILVCRQVRDENDHAPRVTGLQKEQRSRELDARPVCQQERTLCVSFLEAPEALVARVLATDADLSGSQNALLTYSLVSVTPLRHRVRLSSLHSSLCACACV